MASNRLVIYLIGILCYYCRSHEFPKLCSFERSLTDPIQLTNIASEFLLPEGRLEEALHCTKVAIELMNSEENENFPEDAKKVILGNYQIFRGVVSPKPSVDFKRVYHNFNHLSPEFPRNSSDPLIKNQPDKSIQVWDGGLSYEQCSEIIELFEESDHYDGNVMSDGKVIVNYDGKKAREYDVSNSAHSEEDWYEVDKLLLSVMYKYLFKYENVNTAIRGERNPLGDDGFTMRKYRNDGTEHHGYHGDSGQEGNCMPKRVIAVLIYLNDVESGGETVFLNQGIAVKPKCGRVLMFPTSFTHVHAGRRPISNPKYLVTNFITT